MSYDKVDWSEAPESARWWAVDGEGYASWYCEPRVDDFTLSWVQEDFDAPDFGYTGNWQESLTKRP
ncbi:hypothetical protein [Castellaniella sp. GW247-6E4]|uniref:hypothetical protein n=1 Tax=Castellaniella sp. GW247-6E4 TaxID=3140380 RepID=UPI0033152F87